MEIKTSLQPRLQIQMRVHKVNAAITKVFGVEDYESEARISKLKMADPIWISRIQYFSEFWILLLESNLKTLTLGFLRLVMKVLKSDFKL